jgi:hypothetical protein
MMIHHRLKADLTPIVARICVAVLCLAVVLPAASSAAPPGQLPWWDVTPEDEVPSHQYDSILYSEIPARLREIMLDTNRVHVEVIGQSAGGRNLFLVTLSDPQTMGRLGPYKVISRTMLRDPALAQEMIDDFGDFKVPFFVNGSIHGDEYAGVDAAMRLIETLAYEDTPEVQAILENVILLVNVVQNPDGRVMGTRRNANGFDLNRDFITQSQPETRALVEVINDWNPMVFLDFHGYYNPMLIEPCTPPHNPNYEYDLLLGWSYYQALAMEAELLAQTGFDAQIPFRDDADGWDDWAPIYTPMYAMLHGAYGYTLETPYLDERGVDAHYAAAWGALKFVSENRQAMIHDQIEIYLRGFMDYPQMLIPEELLDETIYDQFNELTIMEFPEAYIIPEGEPFQYSDHQAARLVEFLLFNGIEVDQATEGFVLQMGEVDVEYPAGTYVVWMDQPKRGLANTILEDGMDVSGIEGLTFYSPPTAWSLPLLWGVSRVVVEEDVAIATEPVAQGGMPQGSVVGDPAAGYAYLPTNLAAFQATNELLARGIEVQRAMAPFPEGEPTWPSGTLIIPSDPLLASELAGDYALDLFAIDALPVEATTLEAQRIAVYGDEGVAHSLERMGFDYDQISVQGLNNGDLAGYDLFLNLNCSWSSLGRRAQSSLAAFFANGGDYIGLRTTGIRFALDAGLISAETQTFSGNGIIRVDYDPEHPVVAGFWPSDYAYVYNPIVFTAIGEDVGVVASVDGDDFVVAGYWPGWQESGAADMPVILHQDTGSADVTLIGIDATFRGHPENTFRLVGNAILSSLD